LYCKSDGYLILLYIKSNFYAKKKFALLGSKTSEAHFWDGGLKNDQGGKNRGLGFCRAAGPCG
jgi:hypothetical protein